MWMRWGPSGRIPKTLALICSARFQASGFPVGLLLFMNIILYRNIISNAIVYKTKTPRIPKIRSAYCTYMRVHSSIIVHIAGNY